MSCLGLGLVRWPVVSVPTVLVVQGGYSAWGSGLGSQLGGLITASEDSGSRSMHVLYLYAHVCSTKPSCSLMGPRWLIYPILSYPCNRLNLMIGLNHDKFNCLYTFIVEPCIHDM